jgi:hypothetical protein
MGFGSYFLFFLSDDFDYLRYQFIELSLVYFSVSILVEGLYQIIDIGEGGLFDVKSHSESFNEHSKLIFLEIS